MENTKKCVQCGKDYQKNPESSWALFHKQRYCSKVCGLRGRRGEKRPNTIGEKHPHWKGGRRKTVNGYILIHRPKHPYCQSHGYILEHRLVMESKLGRYLHPKEVIHHLNEDKTDNRIENLELLESQAEHMRHHFKQDPITGRLII